MADLISRLLESVDLAIGIAGAAVVLVLFLRFLWPSWRLLHRTVYFGRPFRFVRAFGSTLRLLFYFLEVRSVYTATRLFVEVNLVVERPARHEFPSRTAYREALDAWQLHTHRVLGELVHQVRGGEPTIDVKTCFDLHSAEDRIRRYFHALAAETSKALYDRDRFIAHVRIGTGFIAPLYLITGLLSHFHNDWEPVIDEYAAAVRLENDPLGRKLRKVQTFLFDCWLLWGPSIPLCRCDNWRGYVGMQYGYGDENNSIPVYGEGLFDEFERELVQRIAKQPDQPRPIAYQVSITARLRWGPTMKDRNFCIAQRAVQDEQLGGLILENENIEDIGPTARRTYYSAYLWTLFVICDDQGEPVFGSSEGWRGLIPFYVHGNIAEYDTYIFLKKQLAHAALTALDGIVHDVLDAASNLTFRYACAIDDPGCGEELRFPDSTPKLREIMEQLLTQPSLKRLQKSRRVSLACDSRLEAFASCHLPDVVEAYYGALESAR